MFRQTSLNRGDIATDLAIPLLASGGWRAMTLRTLGKAAKVSSAAVAGWFGTTARLHREVAHVYGNRWLWLVERRVNLALFGSEDEPLTRADVVSALLPAEGEDVIYHRIWLTIIEAARWEPDVATVVADAQDYERGLVLRMLRHLPDAASIAPHDLEAEATLVVALVRGLRQVRCAAARPMVRDVADEVARLYAGTWRQRGEVTSRSAGRTSAR